MNVVGGKTATVCNYGSAQLGVKDVICVHQSNIREVKHSELHYGGCKIPFFPTMPLVMSCEL